MQSGEPKYLRVNNSATVRDTGLVSIDHLKETTHNGFVVVT